MFLDPRTSILTLVKSQKLLLAEGWDYISLAFLISILSFKIYPEFGNFRVINLYSLHCKLPYSIYTKLSFIKTRVGFSP